MGRAGIVVARCTVERLMRQLGLQGVVRGATTRTTSPARAAERPLDLVERNCTAARPNQLWVSDFTSVATWRGMVYTAFVIDVCSRRIVGWRVSRTMQSALGLDALEQAIWERLPASGAASDRVHHSDRGSQELSIRYAERLAGLGIAPSVDSRGDSYDTALAESVIGLDKTERIRKRGPWKSVEEVELETLSWVWWYNHERLLEPLGYGPPAEFELQHAGDQQERAATGAALN